MYGGLSINQHCTLPLERGRTTHILCMAALFVNSIQYDVIYILRMYIVVPWARPLPRFLKVRLLWLYVIPLSKPLNRSNISGLRMVPFFQFIRQGFVTGMEKQNIEEVCFRGKIHARGTNSASPAQLDQPLRASFHHPLRIVIKRFILTPFLNGTT